MEQKRKKFLPYKKLNFRGKLNIAFIITSLLIVVLLCFAFYSIN